MAGIDYRQLQAPVQVDTDLPDNGAAARAAALGSAFKEFEGIAVDYGTKVNTQAGALAGAASGATGNPDYKTGLTRFGAYSQAFNNAATGAYAVQAEAQADDDAARLRVQANNNPATFSTTFSAVRDAVLKNAPAQAVPMLTELYNKHLAAGVSALSGDQAAQQVQLQRQTYDEGVARQTSRVAILQGSANPQDQLQAQDEQVKLSLLIDGGKNSGLYSDAEAQAMHIGAARTITAQVFQTQVDRELADPNGDVVSLLDRFHQAHIDNLSDTTTPTVLSEPEYQKLVADATTKIREQNMLISMNKKEGKTAEQLKWEAGDKLYTSMLLGGKLTDHDLDIATQNGDLKPETARSIHSQLMNGDQAPKSNPKVLFSIRNDPNFLDMTADDVRAIPGGANGVNWTDKSKLIDEIDKRRNSWEGTQASKQAKGSIDAALKIPPGTPMASLSDAQQKSRTDAQQEFIALQNGTDASKRDSMAATNAQTAIKHAGQREAAAEVQQWGIGKQNYIKSHGPGSPAAADDETFKARVKQYDDNIARAQAAAKGQ